jgi:hypothetical protein
MMLGTVHSESVNFGTVHNSQEVGYQHTHFGSWGRNLQYGRNWVLPCNFQPYDTLVGAAECYTPESVVDCHFHTADWCKF